MTPLRQRLIDDLRLRNYAPRAITTYVAAVAQFARRCGRFPEHFDAEAVRQYQLHLLAQRVSWSRFNQAVSALRFLYRVTLQRSEPLPVLPYGKKPRTLPAVLSPEEVARGRGVNRLVGRVLRENTPMLNLTRALGFTAAETGEETVVAVGLDLV